MRFRVGRHLGVAALYVLAHLGLSACSSTEAQQGDENLEASEQNAENGQSQEENASGENAAQGEEATAEEGSNTAEAENTGGMEEGATEGGEETAATEGEGNATENDLQEIISEMNGQPAAGGNAAAGNQALAQAAPAQTAAPAAEQAAPAAAPMAEANAASAAPQTAGPSAGPALPEMGSKMHYIVQAGDTLAKIATKVFGSNNRWKEISNLTGLANPSRIYPGDIVYYTLDQSSVAFATAYESVQRSSTEVKQGDTLATISKRVYGSSNSWKSIWRQNDGIDNPDKLQPGMTVFYIQSGALSAAVKQVRSQMATLATATSLNQNGLSVNMTMNTLNHSANISANSFVSSGLAVANLGV